MSWKNNCTSDLMTREANVNLLGIHFNVDVRNNSSKRIANWNNWASVSLISLAEIWISNADLLTEEK